MAETERGFLGLTHNPFVQPDEGFFEQADRKSHLEQLRHLSQWSRRVLLVTGPSGIGKTTLYRRLSATLEPRCKAARIHASLINTSREVLVSVAQGFGIATPGDANVQLLTAMLKSHVDEQSAAERICVVMVDDADMLEPKAVVELMTLARDCSLQLVLFGDARLVPAIERAALRLDLGWHDIRLQGFSEAQTREYLEWRFQQAKYRGRLPFTESQVKEIQRLSDGTPGRINQMANVLLVKLESGDIGRETVAFPTVHKALLVLLTVVVGLLYLLWQQNEEHSRREAMIVETTELPEPEELEAQAFPQSLPGPADAGDLTESGLDAAPDESAMAQAEPEVTAVAEVATEPATSPAVSSSAAVKTVATGTPADAPTSTSASAATAMEKLEQPAEVDAAAASSAPAVTAVVEPKKPAAAPAPAAVAPVVATPETGGYHDSKWLLAQPADKFTLQLVTVSSAQRAQVFVDAQPDPDDFAVYQLRRDGRVLHVVVYGLFNTRSEADAAARRLPASVGQVKPWIRSIEQVHGAIATMQ